MMEENNHQREFVLDGMTFFSNFDSGNLVSVVKVGAWAYDLQVAADAYARGFSHHRIWFFFGLRNLPTGHTLRFSITNLSPTRAFSSPGYRPVFKELPKTPAWQRLPTECRHELQYPSSCKISWLFVPSEQVQSLYFAFACPYTFESIQNLVSSIGPIIPPTIYYSRETLTYSPDGRPIDLLTISDMSSIAGTHESSLPGLFPEANYRCFRAKKPIIFITARVHPGETPASFCLERFLKFLLSQDVRADVLRRSFVFKIVPVLNPDGVARGHYRVDQFGVNLNRSYLDPSPTQEPSIFAVKRYIEYVQQNVYMFMDMHSQSSKRSCWLFGNSLPLEQQIDNQLFAKLIAINCAYFEYNDCDFSEKSMVHRDPKDLCSKEGSARVSVYKMTGLVHSYTLECPYFCPQPLFRINPIGSSAKQRNRNNDSEARLRGVPCYNSRMFQEIAEGIVLAILDMNALLPTSRLASTAFKNLWILKEYVRSKIMISLKVKNSPRAVVRK